MAKSVYEELSKATGISKNQGEKFPDFTIRVCEGVSKITDEEFAKLSEPARKWYDACVDPINKKEHDKLPALVGFPAETEAGAPAAKPTLAKKAAAKPAAKPAKAAAKPAKTAAKKPAAKVAAKKPAKPAQETLPGVAKGDGKARTDGVAFKVRLAVVKKPAISFEDAAGKAGVEAKVGGHAWNIFNEAKHVMQLAAAEGYARP